VKQRGPIASREDRSRARRANTKVEEKIGEGGSEVHPKGEKEFISLNKGGKREALGFGNTRVTEDTKGNPKDKQRGFSRANANGEMEKEEVAKLKNEGPEVKYPRVGEEKTVLEDEEKTRGTGWLVIGGEPTTNSHPQQDYRKKKEVLRILLSVTDKRLDPRC